MLSHYCYNKTSLSSLYKNQSKQGSHPSPIFKIACFGFCKRINDVCLSQAFVSEYNLEE